MGQRDQARSSIGIVFQDRSSDWWLAGRENLDFHAKMYSLSSEERSRRLEEVLALLDLTGKENVKLFDLPEGVRRRFEVARGFVTSPEVVFLDQPTIGFDIKARMDLWAQIRADPGSYSPNRLEHVRSKISELKRKAKVLRKELVSRN